MISKEAHNQISIKQLHMSFNPIFIENAQYSVSRNMHKNGLTFPPNLVNEMSKLSLFFCVCSDLPLNEAAFHLDRIVCLAIVSNNMTNR